MRKKNYERAIKWMVSLALMLGLFPVWNTTASADAPLSWTGISQDGGSEPQYISDADIPLIVKTGDSIGTLVDSVNASHKLVYSAAYSTVNKIKGGFRFEVISDSTSNRDRYLTFETYKNINGVLTLIDFTDGDTYKNREGNSVYSTTFYSSEIKNESYIYFRATISKDEDSSDISDEIIFKIRPNILFVGSSYNLIEGSYVLFNNESTDGDKTQATGNITNQKAALRSNKHLPLHTYQIDANIPLSQHAAPYSYVKKNTKFTTPPSLGSNNDFWVSDFETEKDYQINAKLIYSGSKVNVWVHDNQITDANAEQLGKEFDSRIYSTIVNAFGKESDVDGDGKINILCYDIQDGFIDSGGYVGGYFNQNDVHQAPNSNGAEILNIDTYPSLGENKDELSNAFSTIAHEFQHLVNHNQNVLIEGKQDGMDVWLDEALSMAAEQIYTGKILTDRIDYYNTSYSIANGHSLLYWDYDGDVLANYSLSYLFGQYIKIQARQGDSIFKEILADPNNNYKAIESIIKKYIDPSLTFGKFTTKFRAAMILKEQTGLLGFYGDPIASSLQPRLYARDDTTIRGGGAIVVKIDPLVGFFEPWELFGTPTGKDITHTILSLNYIPASKIPIQRLVVDPIKDVDDQVKGIAYTNGKITIRADEKEIGSGTADADGHFLIKIPKQPVGKMLQIKCMSSSGFGRYDYQYIQDGTPPEKPIVNPINNKDTELTGEAEKGSEVIVTKNGQVISTGVTNTYGTFSIQLNPQPVGTILKVHVKDSAGNTSEEVEVTIGHSPPAIEEVFKVTNQDRTIKGITDPDSTVYIKKGSTVIGKGKSNQKGAFTIPIPLQKAGTELTIYAENSLNLVSEEQTVTVTAIPGKPSVKAVGDNTVSVKGTAAPDVTIIVMEKGKIVGETESNSNGTFTVRLKAKQKAGTVLTLYVVNSDENKSLDVKVTVQDQTPPPAPKVTSKVTSSSTSITGKGETGSVVYIYNGGKLLAKVNVDKNGAFKGKMAAQKKGVRLAIYAKDKVGNKSAVISVVVR